MNKFPKSIKVVLVALLAALIIMCVGCANKNTAPASTDNGTIFPVSSQVMSESQAAALKGSCRARLYFITQKGDMLSTEMKLISFGEKEKRTEVLASALIKALIAGPANTRLCSTLPEGTTLNGVKISKGTAYVDLSGNFKSGVGTDTNKIKLIAMSITNTLTEFKDINYVTITVDGMDISSDIGYTLNNMERDSSIVTDIDSAARETEYTENVFLEIELE